MSKTHGWIFTKFSAMMQFRAKMNWLDLGFQGSKVKVVAAPNMVKKALLAQLRPHAQPSRNGSPQNLHTSWVWSQGCKPTFGNSHPTAKKFGGKKPEFAKCKLNRVGMWYRA